MQGFAANAVGAAAGLVSQDAFGPVGSPDGFLQRTAVAAIGGGLAAEITGGKFANGAVTAAFAHMLNAEAGRMFGAVGGGYGGAALGTGVAGICAYVTAGGCVTAGPYIVTGGAMIGRAIGGALGSAVEDWVFKGGESSATADGRAAHGNYGTALGDDYDTGVRLPSGKKPDAVNWGTREVRELKPDNPRAIRLGERQVEGYRQELEQVTGKPWSAQVDTYRPGGSR